MYTFGVFLIIQNAARTPYQVRAWASSLAGSITQTLTGVDSLSTAVAMVTVTTSPRRKTAYPRAFSPSRHHLPGPLDDNGTAVSDIWPMAQQMWFCMNTSCKKTCNKRNAVNTRLYDSCILFYDYGFCIKSISLLNGGVYFLSDFQLAYDKWTVYLCPYKWRGTGPMIFLTKFYLFHNISF